MSDESPSGTRIVASGSDGDITVTPKMAQHRKATLARLSAAKHADAPPADAKPTAPLRTENHPSSSATSASSARRSAPGW
jgi:hypothetical protein